MLQSVSQWQTSQGKPGSILYNWRRWSALALYISLSLYIFLYIYVYKKVYDPALHFL